MQTLQMDASDTVLNASRVFAKSFCQGLGVTLGSIVVLGTAVFVVSKTATPLPTSASMSKADKGTTTEHHNGAIRAKEPSYQAIFDGL